MTNTERGFDALGDPTRRLVFSRLRRGPRSVGELSRGMKVTRSAVSQHLRVLKAAHLVFDRAEGTRRLYAIDQAGVLILRQWLSQFWDDALASFQLAAESEAAKSRR